MNVEVNFELDISELAADLVYETEFESAVESLIDGFDLETKIDSGVSEWFDSHDLLEVIDGEQFIRMVANTLKTILDRSDR